jgi:hypothetical protein
MQQRGFPRITPQASSSASTDRASLTQRLAEAATRSLFDWLVKRLVVGAIAAII